MGKQHVDVLHNNASPQECKFCNARFRWRYQLINHIEEFHTKCQETKVPKLRATTKRAISKKQQIMRMWKREEMMRVASNKDPETKAIKYHTEKRNGATKY